MLKRKTKRNEEQNQDTSRCLSKASRIPSEKQKNKIHCPTLETIAANIDHALTIAGIKERYEYVYDSICDYLDNKFKENNYCDFKDGTCISNRSGIGKNRQMGCCYSFRLDMFANMRDKKLCKHLGNNGCDTKCVSCKLYTCKYLDKKGIRFSLFSFPKLDKVFNRKQIEVLKYNCFRTKEEIIDKLVEVNKTKMPYFWFYLLNKAKVGN